MENKYIMDVLVAIQKDIVIKNLEGAYGRCVILYQSLMDEELKNDAK